MIGKRYLRSLRASASLIAVTALLAAQTPAFAVGEEEAAARIVAQPAQAIAIAEGLGLSLTAAEQQALSLFAAAGDAVGVERILKRQAVSATTQAAQPQGPDPIESSARAVDLLLPAAVMGAAGVGAFLVIEAQSDSPSPAKKVKCVDATTAGQLSDCTAGGLTYDAAAAKAMLTDAEFQFSNTSATRKAAGSVSPAEKIKAHVAYGYGLTGAGVKLGIIDAGFNLAGAKTPEVDGNGDPVNDANGDPKIKYTVAKDHADLAGQASFVDAAADQLNNDHGSNVSGMAIGKRHGDGTGGQGIAYGATALVSNVASDSAQFAGVFAGMATKGATVSSNSYGFNGEETLTDAEKKAYTNYKGEMAWDKFTAFVASRGLQGDAAGALAAGFAGDKTQWQANLDAFRTFQTSNGGRGVVVWANSNYGTADALGETAGLASNEDALKRPLGMTDVDATASLPLLDSRLKGAWITVSNVIDKGVFEAKSYPIDKLTAAQRVQIESMKGGVATGNYLISAPCGAAMEFCVSMDGGEVQAAGSGQAGDADEYVSQLGTSQATPQVAGAVALLQQAFPKMSGKDIVTRIFATADNSWFDADATAQLDYGLTHGVSKIWGHGVVDLEKALAPIGQEHRF